MTEKLIRIQGVPSDAAAELWPMVRDWIADALERGSLETPEEVLARIERLEYQLWIIDDGKPAAAFVTEIATGGQGTELVVVCLGGKRMAHWLEAGEDLVTRFARENGCRRIQMYGRRGWARKLGSLGWQEKFVNMTKEL